MAAVPPVPPERRRPRPGSLERPVNGRLYRGTWLLLGLPLLVAAFSVARPVPLPPPQVSSGFDGANATSLAKDLADHYPNRFPGSAGALGAATWLRDQFRAYGFEMRTEPFTAVIPGKGRVELQNLIAEAVGRSPQTIVVMAHRDDDGTGQGANDNASGTAALVELARSYSVRVTPAHTIVFLSTDGGSFGGLGAAHFLAHAPERHDVIAAVNLDAIAGHAPARLQITGDTPRRADLRGGARLARGSVARSCRPRLRRVARVARTAASPPPGSRRGGARRPHGGAAVPRRAVARRRRP